MLLKILIVGVYNVGKTEFIGSISEIDPISTEKKILSYIGGDKEEMTIAIDFGKITIDEDLVLYLFGTPGQERFDFMWDLLSEGILGYIILMDSVDTESFARARKILEFFTSVEVPFVVAANKQGMKGAVDLLEIRRRLNLSEGVELMPCVAKEKESVKAVLLSLLHQVMDLLEE